MILLYIPSAIILHFTSSLVLGKGWRLNMGHALVFWGLSSTSTMVISASQQPRLSVSCLWRNSQWETHSGLIVLRDSTAQSVHLAGPQCSTPQGCRDCLDPHLQICKQRLQMISCVSRSHSWLPTKPRSKLTSSVSKAHFPVSRVH